MKRILIIALCALMLLALVGCKGDGAPAGMKLASHPELVPYSLYVPEDWVVDYSDAQNTKAHVSSVNMSSVLVSQHPKAEGTIDDIDSWWENYKAELSLEGVLVLEQGVKGTVDGKASKSYTYSATINDELTYKYYMTAVEHNGEIIAILYGAPEGPLFDESLSVVKDEIIANLKLK